MQLMPLSLSIGILAAIWTFVSAEFGILTWPAFVGWAMFFFAGANKESLTKNIPPMFSGVILGFISIKVLTAMGGGSATLAVLVGIIAFIMTFMINIPLFATAPAAFAACATYFGVGDPIKAVIPLFIGLILGYISAEIPGMFAGKSDKSQSA